MGLDYVDLYLAHWPLVLQARNDLSKARATPDASNKERGIASDEKDRPLKDWQHTCASISAANDEKGSFQATWRAMQGLVDSGKARAIGTSNFNIEQLQEVLAVGGKVPLSCNQVEAHPWFPNSDLFAFMDQHSILKSAFCPFAGQKAGGLPLVKDPTVIGLAKKNGMGVGQLLQSWAVQRTTIPLGKSQTIGEWYMHEVFVRAF